MNLRERLRLLRPAGTSKRLTDDKSHHENRNVPSIPAASRASSVSYGSLIEEEAEGAELHTSAGPVWCVERCYPLDFSWGAMALQKLEELSLAGWRPWVRNGAPSPASSAVAFLDTETTGLERGTGTYAFLVGVGRMTGEGFRVRQFLMRDYDEEPALLEAVAAELSHVDGVVTFNGLSFDWPLLHTRATLGRLSWPELPQLDLLYPARRLWKPITGDCRLGRLEEAILQVNRGDDVPGYLIPQLYFQFLHERQMHLLSGVLEHNRFDILTTAALAVYVTEAVSRPLEASPLGRRLPGSDLYAVGRLWADRREWEQAIVCLEEALRRGLPAHLRKDCRRLLSSLYRRQGRWDRAVPLWHALVNEGDRFTVWPYVELAKYYEHRAKDLAAAKQWTLRAMDIVQRRRLLRRGEPHGPNRNRMMFGNSSPRRSDAEWSELRHRLQRLDAKLARAEARHCNEGSQLTLKQVSG